MNSPATSSAALLITEVDCRLNLASSGQAQAWLGPALKGVTSIELKSRVCQQPRAEQDTRWLRCSGCPLMSDCAHGQLFEPDPPPGTEVMKGQEETTPPMVIDPFFPLPETLEQGSVVGLRLKSIGGNAQRFVSRLIEALEHGGRRGLGSGRERLFFEVERQSARIWQLQADHLPPGPKALAGRIPQLMVRLESPLFLQAKDERGRKRAIIQPSFSDLLRASLRSLGQLFRVYGGSALPADFKALKEAAAEVSLVDHDYQPFVQPHWSNRGQKHHDYHAVTGMGLYENVPMSYLPWMLWGGKLHVGTHRIAGAGKWTLELT